MRRFIDWLIKKEKYKEDYLPYETSKYGIRFPTLNDGKHSNKLSNVYLPAISGVWYDPVQQIRIAQNVIKACKKALKNKYEKS